LGLRAGVEITSCPTCGRSETGLTAIVQEVEERLADWPEPIHVAIMGCSVNGPGEAREADVGLAAGKGRGKAIQGEVLQSYAHQQVEAMPDFVEDFVGDGFLPPR
jgi:(E)-4-hydroxy-3-methylbut-2-enyl-diphosphate synthase